MIASPAVRLRHHVNPLKGRFIEDSARRRAGWGARELDAERALEVELGCADAQYLFQRAARHPEVRCLGIEIRADLVDEVNRRAEEQGLENLRAIFAHANLDLGELFQPSSLTRIFINFPDPWFKRRHHKRRLVDGALAATVERLLRPGGGLLFQSDVFDLALDAMAVLEETGLRNRYGPWSFVPGELAFAELEARSLREDRCRDKGMPIWRLRYDRPGL